MTQQSQPQPNPFDAARNHSIKVEFSNGDILETEINGTSDAIVDYYMKSTFNLGREDDNITKARKIWFWDGEVYLQHKGV